MGDGRWEMGDGRWEMGDGRWEMERTRGVLLLVIPAKAGIQGFIAA